MNKTKLIIKGKHKIYTVMKRIIVLVLCFISIQQSIRAQPQYFIDAEFPGGNIDVEKMTKDTVWLKPNITYTEGYWFYWNFKVRNAQNKKLVFSFTNKEDNVFSNHGPAYSNDGGNNWKWIGKKESQNNTFEFSFGRTDSVVQFCVTIPYTHKNLYEFLNQQSSNLLELDTLCKTRFGRPAEQITIKSNTLSPKYKVLLTARNHACEAMVSYVLEGIMDAILNDKNLDWSRQNVEFMVIPFIDKDGVQKGEQGKNRTPRDHNRDYIGNSIYNTTETIRKKIPKWAGNKLKLSLDLHDPWIDEARMYMVGTRNEKNEREQKKFNKIIENQNNSELEFRAEDFLHYGQEWNTSKKSTKKRSLKYWVLEEIDGVKLSTTLEFPYSSDAAGNQITKKNARTFGHDLAKAIQKYLKPVR